MYQDMCQRRLCTLRYTKHGHLGRITFVQKPIPSTLIIWTPEAHDKCPRTNTNKHRHPRPVMCVQVPGHLTLYQAWTAMTCVQKPVHLYQ